MNSEINIIALDSSKTPKAIGPYSKGTKVDMGDKYMIFCSGSLGVDPVSGNLVSEDVSEQTKQALENIKNFLEDNSSSLDNVAKTLIFLDSMEDFKAVNDIYSTYFVKTLPARSCVAVKTLPKNAKVEIEAIAFAPKI